MSAATQADRIETLQRQAAALSARARALTLAYERSTWFRFTMVFFPVPFTVLLFRFELENWHYYLAGGAYIVFSMALFTYDSAKADKRDAAVHAAEDAAKAVEEAAVEAARSGIQP
jgi:hypothetical protein